MKTRKSLGAAFVFALLLSSATAHAATLNVWNVAQLDASDDYIDIQLGTSGGKTTLTLQWVGGAADTPGAIGVDKLFINNTDTSLEVSSVYRNAILAANDVTSAWLPTNGGTNAGGGFGLFVEKVTEASGDGGIAPNSLIFVLNGLYAPASFVPNADGATFAAHVRYANSCSGWVADGGTGGDGGSDSKCGRGGTPVPEPGAATVFGAGALIFAGALRRRR
jgi:hypothetical protein